MHHLIRSATMVSAIALGVTAAQAADLTYEPAPVAAPVAFNWTGFYVGVHGGIGGGDFDTQQRIYWDQLIAGRAVSPYGVDTSDNAFGAFGGAQIGYNYQFATNWVAGVEADIAASGIKAEYSESYDGGEYSWHSEAKIDWFGTIRGRLGYAWDNVLFYGTGGAAYGKIKLSGGESEGGYGYNNYSDSQTKWGWTAGAGIEYGITQNITLKTEYLYVDLGTATFDNVVFDGYESEGKLDAAFHTLKVGLNYKF
jgi:outer membrane immunogenic protein